MNLTQLYDVDLKRISKVEKISSRVRCSHTFGGSLKDLGYSITGAKGRLHLLYRFDQDDILVPSALTNARFLLLCYGFYCTDHSSSDLITAYLVISDNQIELLSPKGKWTPDVSFYDEYPSEFPLLRVKLKSVKYNARDAKEAIKYSAVFHLKDLDTAVRKAALDLARPSHQKLLDYGETDLELEEFLNVHSTSFMQGAPDNACIYRGCRSRGENWMKTIAVVEGHPTESARLWSDTDVDPFVQLIFQQCLDCRTIYVTQQAG